MRSKIDMYMRGLSDKERLPYDLAARKMYNDYEEMVFNLSEQSSNETIESIKNMSIGQRLKFQDLIVKRNKNLKARMKNGREEL